MGGPPTSTLARGRALPAASPRAGGSGSGGLLRRVLAFTLALACAAFGTGAPAASLVVVSDPDSPFHQAIADRLAAEFDARHGGDGRARVERLDQQQFAGHSPNPQERTLVVTIGARAAASLGSQAPAAPVLNVFLPLASYRYLQAESDRQSAAIVLDQPLHRQLAVARVLLPDARRAAMLVAATAAQPAPSDPDQAGAFGFELSTTRVDGDSSPVDAIREVLRAGDLVIVTFDPAVYTPVMAKWLLYLASQNQQPLIGFSRALLEAGALASVFTTPEQIAQQAVEVVRDWLLDERLPNGFAYPRYYRVGVNGRVARQLGVTAPAEPALEQAVRMLLEKTP